MSAVTKATEPNAAASPRAVEGRDSRSERVDARPDISF